jgi:hypothetical protein
VTVVLLHSPLVGPLTWQAVAGCLRASGHTAVVPDLSAAVHAGPPHLPALATALADALRDAPRSWTLVGHSGAGPMLPALAAALGDVDAMVYVDALLPYEKGSWWENAPAPLVRQLAGMVREGMLPAWHEWFDPADIAALLPDLALRRAFIAELRPIPLSFFTEPVPVPAGRRPGPAHGPAGYLLMSEAYRPAADRARSAGLPVVEAIDHHLAMLTAPAPVAVALDRLLSRVRT